MLNIQLSCSFQTAPGSSPPPSPTAAPPVVERTATGMTTNKLLYNSIQYAGRYLPSQLMELKVSNLRQKVFWVSESVPCCYKLLKTVLVFYQITSLRVSFCSCCRWRFSSRLEPTYQFTCHSFDLFLHCCTEYKRYIVDHYLITMCNTCNLISLAFSFSPLYSRILSHVFSVRSLLYADLYYGIVNVNAILSGVRLGCFLKWKTIWIAFLR